MNYFSLSEFCITEKDIPQDVADKILDIINIMNPVRIDLGAPIIVSKKSGYRPAWYEIEHGRSGNSQHTFSGGGAVDVTCNKRHFKRLLGLLRASSFRRVCIYPREQFIHCDLRPSDHKVYQCLNGIDWEKVWV